MIKVARCTCFIGARFNSESNGFASGTAFFVGPTTLLTAGHIASDEYTSVVAQPPGTLTAVLDVEHLFIESPLVETFHCKVVLKKPACFVDLTILNCLNFSSRFRLLSSLVPLWKLLTNCEMKILYLLRETSSSTVLWTQRSLCIQLPWMYSSQLTLLPHRPLNSTPSFASMSVRSP